MSKKKKKIIGAPSIFQSFFEGVGIAMEAIKANKLRSFLTCLGIIIGVATVISMMSIIKGINNIVEVELGRVGANVFFVKRFPSMQLTFDWRKFRSSPHLSPADWKAISANCPSVEEVSPELSDDGKTVIYEGESTDANVRMVGATEPYFRVNGLNLSEGRFFTHQEVQKNRNVCILGVFVVERLFPFQTPVGKSVRIQGKEYYVIGVVEKLGTIFGFDQDNIVIVPLSKIVTSREHRHHGPDMSISVQAYKGIPISKAMDEVRVAIRIARGLKPTQPDNFELETRDSIMRTYQSITGSVFGAAIGIAFISLLVGGIGIMNIMLVSVRERTREIGIRKAIGARRRDILWQFLIEAMTLSVVGGLCGIALGVGGLKLAAHYIELLPVNITLFSILIAVSFSVLVGIFFGVYPARKAASLDPIESLRYE